MVHFDDCQQSCLFQSPRCYWCKLQFVLARWIVKRSPTGSQWFNLLVNMAIVIETSEHWDVSSRPWSPVARQIKIRFNFKMTCYLVPTLLSPRTWFQLRREIRWPVFERDDMMGQGNDGVRLLDDILWWPPSINVIKMWGPGMCGMDLIEYWLN